MSDVLSNEKRAVAKVTGFAALLCFAFAALFYFVLPYAERDNFVASGPGGLLLFYAVFGRNGLVILFTGLGAMLGLSAVAAVGSNRSYALAATIAFSVATYSLVTNGWFCTAAAPLVSPYCTLWAEYLATRKTERKFSA